MKYFLIAQRYANGLSETLADPAGLEAAFDALAWMSQLYLEEHDFRSILANPAIDVQTRVGVLREVTSTQTIPETVVRLAEVMLRRGRIALLPDVTTVFGMIINQRLGRVTAKVKTTTPLKDDQEKHLRDVLEGLSGKTVLLDSHIDPEIIGGIVAQIGDTVLDGSLRARLESMKQALLAEEK